MMEYNLLTKTYFENCVDSVVQTFLYDEPMTKSLLIKEPEFRYFVNLLCKKMVLEKMSFVCVKNSKVIGFCLNEDLITDLPREFNKITPKMNPILDLLKKLDKQYLLKKKKEKNKYFHIFMIGVVKEYRGKKIIQKLIQKSLKLAKLKNYQKIITEATSKKSQNLFIEKFGFKEQCSIDYKKYKFKNKKVFASIDEKKCKLLEANI